MKFVPVCKSEIVSTAESTMGLRNPASPEYFSKIHESPLVGKGKADSVVFGRSPRMVNLNPGIRRDCDAMLSLVPRP